MPEKTWIERAKLILELGDSRDHSPRVRQLLWADTSEAAKIQVGMAKVMMLIALVEELRKTNAILAQMQRRKG